MSEFCLIESSHNFGVPIPKKIYNCEECGDPVCYFHRSVIKTVRNKEFVKLDVCDRCREKIENSPREETLREEHERIRWELYDWIQTLKT